MSEALVRVSRMHGVVASKTLHVLVDTLGGARTFDGPSTKGFDSSGLGPVRDDEDTNCRVAVRELTVGRGWRISGVLKAVAYALEGIVRVIVCVTHDAD